MVFFFAPALQPPQRPRLRASRAAVAKLLSLAEFSGELDHDQHGKFLLRLRGAEFAGEECRILGLTRFDETPADCLSAISA